MELIVKLVTKVDVIAINPKTEETTTFKIADNPILESVKVGDKLHLEATNELKVSRDQPSTEQLAKQVRKSQDQAPSASRGSASNHKNLARMG